VRVRKLSQDRPWTFLVGATILKPVLIPLASRTWINGDKIPATGGCIVAANHISHLDPLTMAHFVYDHGRVPRYLAKSSLFTNRLLGSFLRSAGQIPVERLSRHAAGAYAAAVAAVNDGECVVIYPEGTLTRDPDLWPMAGKSGAARIALATGCPVIPVGQWGAQDILPPYSRKPDVFPRKHLIMKAGDPVVLDDLLALPPTTEVVAKTTERIMAAITSILVELRGEAAPTAPFDQSASGRQQTGNPNGTSDRKKQR
jgi:1-acyl-sn-glycerol-3-phosphate acyltransferase